MITAEFIDCDLQKDTGLSRWPVATSSFIISWRELSQSVTLCLLRIYFAPSTLTLEIQKFRNEKNTVPTLTGIRD